MKTSQTKIDEKRNENKNYKRKTTKCKLKRAMKIMNQSYVVYKLKSEKKSLVNVPQVQLCVMHFDFILLLSVFFFLSSSLFFYFNVRHHRHHHHHHNQKSICFDKYAISSKFVVQRNEFSFDNIGIVLVVMRIETKLIDQ